jgi:hypothetical protein
MTGPYGETRDFDAFVKRQQALASEAAQHDWAKERDEWLDRLNELYTNIEDYLGNYIRDGAVSCNYRDISLTEEDLGCYQAREMVIKIGLQQITLKPLGTMFIGTKGLVEVVGVAGDAMLTLVNSKLSRRMIKIRTAFGGKIELPGQNIEPTQISWSWKIQTKPPQIEYVELTKDSFLNLLMEVSNG